MISAQNILGAVASRRVSLLSRRPLTRNQRYRRSAKGKEMVHRANARARAKQSPGLRAQHRSKQQAWERANIVQRRVYKRMWERRKARRAKEGAA